MLVVQDPAELAEFAAPEEAYELSPISVMPQGTTSEAVLTGIRNLQEPVRERGYCRGTRLHTLLWGSRRADSRGDGDS